MLRHFGFDFVLLLCVVLFLVDFHISNLADLFLKILEEHKMIMEMVKRYFPSYYAMFIMRPMAHTSS